MRESDSLLRGVGHVAHVERRFQVERLERAGRRALLGAARVEADLAVLPEAPRHDGVERVEPHLIRGADHHRTRAQVVPAATRGQRVGNERTVCSSKQD